MDIDQPAVNRGEMRIFGGKFANGWTKTTRILCASGERRWLTDHMSATSHATNVQKQP